MTTLQKTLVTATVAVLAGAGIYEGRQAAQLRKQVQTLQRQQAPLGAQIRQLQQERDDATNQLALLTEDIAKNKKDNLELLKLRGEVGVLRNQLAEAKLKATQSSASSAGQVTSIAHRPGTYISKDELEFVGYATPEAALESISWALYRGTYEQANEGLGPDLRAGELEDPKRKQSFEAGQAQAALVMKGIQIVAMKVLADDKVELKVKSDYDPEALKRFTSHLPPEYMVQPMVKIGNEWKLGGSTRGYQATWESDGQIQNFVP